MYNNQKLRLFYTSTMQVNAYTYYIKKLISIFKKIRSQLPEAGVLVYTVAKRRGLIKEHKFG